MTRKSKVSVLPDDSRRVFMRRVTFLGGGVMLWTGACKKDEPPVAAAQKPAAPTTEGSHRTFTHLEFVTLSAAVDRLIPKDEDPGALEANVPEYIDRILQSPEIKKLKEDFVPGVAALERRAQRMFKVGFAQATAAQQDELLAIFKESEERSGEARWYEMLMTLTMEGFLGDPSYGGNKNRVGWQLVGFELVGREASEPQEGYNGIGHLHSLKCGGGKGC
jgi:gluconate 2-dehydrogenase gamma chain